MCKDKRQICKSQVSLGMTAGSKENKNTLQACSILRRKRKDNTQLECSSIKDNVGTAKSK